MRATVNCCSLDRKCLFTKDLIIHKCSFRVQNTTALLASLYCTGRRGTFLSSVCFFVLVHCDNTYVASLNCWLYLHNAGVCTRSQVRYCRPAPATHGNSGSSVGRYRSIASYYVPSAILSLLSCPMLSGLLLLSLLLFSSMLMPFFCAQVRSSMAIRWTPTTRVPSSSASWYQWCVDPHVKPGQGSVLAPCEPIPWLCCKCKPRVTLSHQ